MNITLNKQSIISSFSRHALSYDEHAEVQQRSADLLIEFMANEQKLAPIAPGPALEIGCGTGIFTEKLIKAFDDVLRPFHHDQSSSGRSSLFIASDISASMLDRCKLRVGTDSRISFVQLDAETISVNQTFALICSSYSLQWMNDFEKTIEKLIDHLEPKGQLFIAIPIEGSFQEWREECESAAVPFTANALPNHSKILQWCQGQNISVEWTISPITCKFDSSLTFFKSLRGVGASVNTSGKRLTAAQLRRLTSKWDARKNGQVEVTYQVLCAKFSSKEHAK